LTKYNYVEMIRFPRKQRLKKPLTRGKNMAAVRFPTWEYNGQKIPPMCTETVYHPVYRHAFFASPCTGKCLISFGGVGLQNGFHAVNSGSNPLGDAKFLV
jgi:hypothetical protein